MVIWRQGRSPLVVPLVPSLLSRPDTSVHGADLQTRSPSSIWWPRFVVFHARCLRSSLWFVAAVLLCWVCVILCSSATSPVLKGPACSWLLFFKCAYSVFSCCDLEFFEMFLGPVHLWLLRFKSMPVVSSFHKFLLLSFYLRKSVFLLCFSFTLTLQPYLKHFGGQPQVQVVTCTSDW